MMGLWQVRRRRPHRADTVCTEPLAARDPESAEPDVHERERQAGSAVAGADADDPPDGQERIRWRGRGAEHARLQRRSDESPRGESTCGADDTGEAEAFRVSVRKKAACCSYIITQLSHAKFPNNSRTYLL